MGKSIFNSDLNTEVSLPAKSRVHPSQSPSTAELEESQAERERPDTWPGTEMESSCPLAWCREIDSSNQVATEMQRKARKQELAPWRGAGPVDTDGSWQSLGEPTPGKVAQPVNRSYLGG